MSKSEIDCEKLGPLVRKCLFLDGIDFRANLSFQLFTSKVPNQILLAFLKEISYNSETKIVFTSFYMNQ